MASVFRIVVDPDSELRAKRASDSLVGAIYLAFDSEAFPGRGWTDFAYPILGWWIVECERLMNGVVPNCELAFMDGPVSVHLSKVSDTVVEARCVVREKGVDDREFVVRFEDIVNELERVCLLLDDACERRKLKVDKFAPHATRLNSMFERNGKKLKRTLD